MTFNPIPAAHTQDGSGGGAPQLVARPRYIPTLTDVVNADDLRGLASGASDHHVLTGPEHEPAQLNAHQQQLSLPLLLATDESLRAQVADALMAQQSTLVQALLAGLQPLVADIVKQAVVRELALLRRQETDRLYSSD